MSEKKVILSIPQAVIDAAQDQGVDDLRETIREFVAKSLGINWPSRGGRSAHGLNAAQKSKFATLVLEGESKEDALELAKHYIPTPRPKKDRPQRAAPPKKKA